jgi:hypothetical protein
MHIPEWVINTIFMSVKHNAGNKFNLKLAKEINSMARNMKENFRVQIYTGSEVVPEIFSMDSTLQEACLAKIVSPLAPLVNVIECKRGLMKIWDPYEMDLEDAISIAYPFHESTEEDEKLEISLGGETFINRIVSTDRFFSEEEKLYALGPVKDRQAILIGANV